MVKIFRAKNLIFRLIGFDFLLYAGLFIAVRLLSSLHFFVITNFEVRLRTNYYLHTLSGDLVYTSIFFCLAIFLFVLCIEKLKKIYVEFLYRNL